MFRLHSFVTQVWWLVVLYLQAVQFLYSQHFEGTSLRPLGQIQSGNIFVRDEHCKLGGYDNTLLGYRSTDHQKIAANGSLDYIDTVMFGECLLHWGMDVFVYSCVCAWVARIRGVWDGEWSDGKGCHPYWWGVLQSQRCQVRDSTPIYFHEEGEKQVLIQILHSRGKVFSYAQQVASWEYTVEFIWVNSVKVECL